MTAPLDELALVDWILQEGLRADQLGDLLRGFSERLLEGGATLLATGIGMPTVDPTASFLVANWWRREPRSAVTPAMSLQSRDRFLVSPINDLLQRQRNHDRWKLDDPRVVARFPLFGELRQEGATEYALSIVGFGEARTALRGIALWMVTDRPAGLADAEVAAVTRTLPALALAAYRIGLLHVATEALGAYLGPLTAGEVLQGMVHRGDSRTISAALLLADLRGFTATVDRLGAASAIAWLNESLEAIADPVALHGGEVLKFLGDGLLAVFPAGEDAGGACRAASAAAAEIKARMLALNAGCEPGAARSDIVLVLHFGEVIYGNIGAAQRLDFTVIGEAVNEASRMEGLCKSLDRDLVMSARFAADCGLPTRSIGRYALRGISGEREIFVLA